MYASLTLPVFDKSERIWRSENNAQMKRVTPQIEYSKIDPPFLVRLQIPTIHLGRHGFCPWETWVQLLEMEIHSAPRRPTFFSRKTQM